MKGGFTLIELLVVIVIIGILATLATVGLNSVRAKARDSKRISDIRQMQSALELYFNDNNAYPTNGDFVIGTPLDSPDGTRTYMAKIPSNPKPWAEGACVSGGAEYSYAYINANSYQLSYCLANKVNDLSAGSATAMPGNINNACAKQCTGKYCGDSDGCGGSCSGVPTVGGSTVLMCTANQIYCGATLISDYRMINQCNTNTADCSGVTCGAGQICQSNVCVSPECDASICGDCSATACGSNCVTTIKKDGADYTETYGTVTVGAQCWMTKGVSKVGYFVNGGVSSDDTKIERWCYNDDESYCSTDGALYTWNEAMYLPASYKNTVFSASGYTGSGTASKRQGVCPKGWHIPSDFDLATLETTLDTGLSTSAFSPGGNTCGSYWAYAANFTCGSTVAPYDSSGYGTTVSTKLKTGGSSGLNIFLGGLRTTTFNARLSNHYLWSSSQYSATGVWARNIHSSVPIYRVNSTKTNGQFVRCVKD